MAIPVILAMRPLLGHISGIVKSKIDYEETFNHEPCSVLFDKLLEECSVTSSEDMSNIFYEYLKHAIEANFTWKRIKTALNFPKRNGLMKSAGLLIEVLMTLQKNIILVLLLTGNNSKLYRQNIIYNRIKQSKRRIYE